MLDGMSDYAAAQGTTGDLGKEHDSLLHALSDEVRRLDKARSSNMVSTQLPQRDQDGAGTDPAMEPEKVLVDIASINIPEFHNQAFRSKPRLQPLQEWEGYVTEIHDETFVARLVDKTAGADVPEEEGEFPFSDVSDSDRELVKPGAIFRWTIGYLKSASGSKKRVSQIVFRRLPQWTRKELALAEMKAKEIASAIAWE